MYAGPPDTEPVSSRSIPSDQVEMIDLTGTLKQAQISRCKQESTDDCAHGWSHVAAASAAREMCSAAIR
jgi:hypothetical protein